MYLPLLKCYAWSWLNCFASPDRNANTYSHWDATCAPCREAAPTYMKTCIHRHTEVNIHAERYLISDFPANFFWLTQSSVMVSHWSQLIRCYAIEYAWLAACVFTEGPQQAAVMPTSITCWVLAFMWVVCVCVCVCICIYTFCVCLLLWEYVPTSRPYLHICIYQRAVSECSSPFSVYVTVLLCHPTLPIITHKKKTAHIPWDRRTHTYSTQTK